MEIVSNSCDLASYFGEGITSFVCTIHLKSVELYVVIEPVQD